jgi:hypothetical protein
MINKFDKVVKRNKDVIDENHPDFEPTSLSLAEQFKYWDKKNEIARAKRNAEKEVEAKQESRYTHYRPKN